MLGYQTRFATAGYLLWDCLVNRVISAPGDGLRLVILGERELRGEKQVSQSETREWRGRQLDHDQRQRGGIVAIQFERPGDDTQEQIQIGMRGGDPAVLAT